MLALPADTQYDWFMNSIPRDTRGRFLFRVLFGMAWISLICSIAAGFYTDHLFWGIAIGWAVSWVIGLGMEEIEITALRKHEP